MAAAVVSVTTIVAGYFVLGRTFDDSVSADALAWWSVVLAGVWATGGLALVLLGGVSVPAHTASTRRSLAVAFGGGALVAAAFAIGSLILLQIPVLGDAVREAVSTANRTSVVAVVSVALIAGAAEECFFRIGVPRWVTSKWRLVVPTVLYAAVTSGSGNVSLVVAAAVLGACCSLVYETTGRWYAPIVVHAMWTLTMVAGLPAVVGAE